VSVGWAKARKRRAHALLTEADQQIAAAVGERKREEKRSTFDLEPPIAGHQSFPKCFGGHGAEPVVGPRFARTRWHLCPPYACLRR